MIFKYRVKGKVNNRFVLRGFLFEMNRSIDFCVSEQELDFVKQHCTIKDLIDLDPEPVVEIPEPIQEVEVKKEDENELPVRTKQTNRTNKAKSKAKV